VFKFYSTSYAFTQCIAILTFLHLQFCRAPCGSGVTARIAQQFARNLIGLGQTRKFESPTGSKFNAKLIREVKYAEYDAVVVEISGHGYYTGKSTFTLEEEDDIGKGFLLA
jgi:trans-L-3-hydroxyproline dehydratase